VEASAAQNLPVTKTCSQCGAVLLSTVRACNFCDSSFSVEASSWEEPSDVSAKEKPATNGDPGLAAIDRSKRQPVVSQQIQQYTTWRGEVSQRLEAYRTRRRRLAPSTAQSQFSFDDPGKTSPHTSAAVAEPPGSVEEDFSFTVAIGSPAKKRVIEQSRMVIDVSVPPDSETPSQTQLVAEHRKSQHGLHPVASIDDRRLAALIDFGCLVFAYGGFLMLFGSLGGQFTLSKLNAAVYATTFAIVYLQYFALFTTFGGTTPGMMMRGLQVVSFSGEPPTPRQMLLRSAGYMLSAGTFFLGFLWAMWDEDELTWHDRLSRTHLSAAHTFADLENSSVAHSR
jgi:uncharacterized RDD family membrane protein YckC